MSVSAAGFQRPALFQQPAGVCSDWPVSTKNSVIAALVAAISPSCALTVMPNSARYPRQARVSRDLTGYEPPLNRLCRLLNSRVSGIFFSPPALRGEMPKAEGGGSASQAQPCCRVWLGRGRPPSVTP